MAKDLSPKSTMFVPAEKEIVMPTLDMPMGQRIGGLSMFGDSFKRGSGANVFGASNEGIWLGAADFADAPFSVDLAGNTKLNSLSVGDYLTKPGENQAISGSIILGGSVNGSLTVKDSSDNTRVTLDQDGILIKNEDSVTIIDSYGIVSNNNFQSAVASKAGGFGQVITSSSYVDLTDSSFSITVTRDTWVIFLADIRAKVKNVGAGNVSGQGFLNIVVNGTPELHTEILIVGEYDSVNKDHYGEFLTSSFSTHSIKKLSAGTSTVKLQGKLINTTNSQLEIYNYKFSYLILGS